MSSNALDVKRVLAKGLPLAALVSAVLSVVLFEIVTRILGMPVAFAQDANEPLQPLGIGSVLGASIVPAVVAALVLIGLGRFVRRPVLVFYVVAAVFLAVSMGGPFSVLSDASHTRWVLAAMHVLSGVSIAAILGRTAGATMKR
jgi:ABC-type sugar transport system permease subunit